MTPSSSTSSSDLGSLPYYAGTARIPAFDGIRAIAAMMVMCLHFTTVSAVPWGVRRVALAGQTGVDLFFVLSGFLITRILLSSRQSEHYFSHFYMRRVLRIFPLYYAFLVVYFFILPRLVGSLPPPVSEQLWSWFFLENIPLTFTWLKTAGPNPYWSLAVEEHFYLFWPFLVFSCQGRRLRTVLWILILAAPLVRLILLAADLGTYFFTLSRMDGLAFGALVACLYEEQGIGAPRWMVRTRAVAVGSALMLLAMFIGFSGAQAGWVQVAKLSLTPVFYAAILMFCLVDPAGRNLRRILSSSALRWLGGISYGLYVLHPLALMAVVRIPGVAGRLGLCFVAFFATTVVMAFLSHRYFEAPILRLKERFSDQLPRRATDSLVALG